MAITKDELVTKVIEKENSAFTDSDKSDLLNMPEDFLKRLYISLLQPTSAHSVSVSNNADVSGKDETSQQTENVKNESPTKEDLEIQKWKRDLLEVQAKVSALRQEEKALLKSLGGYGISAKSVFNGALDLTESDIDLFVSNSQSPIAEIMREAIVTRNQQRQRLIDSIIVNSGGLYTVEELSNKNSDELQKLSELSSRRAPEPEMTNLPLNWQGAGIADLTITNLGNYGDPLALPSTWEPLSK
jgi:hypothetical protein